MVQTVKLSEKEIANKKSQRIMNGIAAWCGFYRCNPQRFVKDYLNITLKTFQKFLIYAMMHNNHFLFWAARSIGKTWLTALFCVVRCILFPGTKICIASGTRGQANEVLEKILTDFCVRYSWGSDNLRREIDMTKSSVGTNKAEIIFHNGSWIKVVTASDSARGNRANILVIDEFRMVDKNTIQTVLKRFMGNPRQPAYLNLPEYKDKEEYLETNIEIYMSSAWFKSHWSYEKSKAYTVNLLGGRPGYFVCAIPYQMAIKEGLKKRVEIEDEMSESDFDEMTFSMEMCCLPIGDGEESFFSSETVTNCRKLQTALYPPDQYDKQFSKIQDLLTNERRILSVDIALMASKKHKNDASSIIINDAIPTNKNTYTANIVYLESHEGLLTNKLALKVRRLFDAYKCTDLVIDAAGAGQGVFDLLVQDMYDDELGKVYPALGISRLTCNDKAMIERCPVDKAPQVIHPIKASETFNTKICTLLRSAFKNNNINLLVSELEIEEKLRTQIKGYNKMIADKQVKYKLPYIETTFLVYELIRLQHEIKGTNIRIYELSGARKDRYSSLAYNYYIMNQLEISILRKPKTERDITDMAKAYQKLNRKPNMY